MNISDPRQREVMKTYTLLDEGLELTASRRNGYPSGWRQPGRMAVLVALDDETAAAVVDELSDTYYVRHERTGRVLTPEAKPDDGGMWVPSTADAETKEGGGKGGDLTSDAWWTAREIAERAGCNRDAVYKRIRRGAFEARWVTEDEGHPHYKVRVTDDVRVFCGLMYRKVVRLTKPWYNVDELAALLDRHEQTMYKRWGELTQVPHPIDGRRRIALLDDVLVQFVDEHDVRPVVACRFYPVTPEKVERIVRGSRLDRQAA